MKPNWPAVNTGPVRHALLAAMTASPLLQNSVGPGRARAPKTMRCQAGARERVAGDGGAEREVSNVTIRRVACRSGDVFAAAWPGRVVAGICLAARRESERRQPKSTNEVTRSSDDGARPGKPISGRESVRPALARRLPDSACSAALEQTTSMVGKAGKRRRSQGRRSWPLEP